MACECNWTDRNCEWIIKVMNIIGALLLVALSILRFIYNTQLTNFLQFLLTIYYLLFGAIILSTELGWQFVKTYFSFQERYTGRGLFLILYIYTPFLIYSVLEFCALTLLGIIDVSFGVAICAIGFISFIFGCCTSSESQDAPAYQNPSAPGVAKIEGARV